MKHKFKTFLLIFGLVFGFMMNVHADVTIKEDASTYEGDVYIIGSSKFDSNTIVTGTMASVAGAREAYIQYVVNQNYKFKPEEVKIYYYSELAESWSLLPETSEDKIKELNVAETKELTENLNIFFVNNDEKVLEFEYEGNVTNVTNGVTYEDGKFSVPATTFTFEFEEDGVEHVVYTEPENTTGDDLNFGSFDVVEKENVVATVGPMQFENLQDALNASTETNPAKMLKDLTLDEILEANGNGTYNVLDLNGHTLTSVAEEVLKVNGVNNTLKITNGNVVAHGSATLFVGTKVQDEKSNKLIVDKNVKITGEEYGIYIVGDKSELDFNGELKTIAENSVAILGNGNEPCANTIINVGKNAKIDATQKGSFAFYLPQAGTVTVDGGTFKADTVIGIKAGMLTINGGTFTATGEKIAPEGYGNGIYSTGDVIIIEENKDYADNIRVFVADGATLISTNGYVLQEHLYSGENRTVVSGKYATYNKLETGAYYSDTKEAVFEQNGLYGKVELLEAALNASTSEKPVRLLKDITLNEILILDVEGANNVLDLNGYTLTSVAEEVLKVNGINNTLKITNGNIIAHGSATLFVGTKEQDGKYNKLIVDKNVKITGEEYGIYIVGDKSELDFNGELKTIAENSVAILGSGNAPCANTIINVGKDAKIDATQKGSFVFYLPQAGTVTIDGGTIKGDTVVGIKAGTLTINGGILTATGEKAIPEGYNNGIYSTGDVIIIEENKDYADNIRVFVADAATLTSTNGYAIQEHLYSGENRAVVTGKYAATNKLDTGAYYTESSKAQAKIAEVLYGNLQEALDNASNGETVVLLNDVTYEDCDATPLKYLATGDDRTAVVDLNGKTVAATVNNTQSMFLLVVGSVNADKNNGTATLRIMDSSEDMTGTLTVMPNKESSAWKVSVATISVERLGRLIVDSGNIITVGGESNAKNPYAIDVKSNTGPQTAELTINGGYLESKTGMGVRLFGNSSTGAAKFTMNGGEIVAGSSDRGVWLQQSGGATYHLVEFTMNGGKITAGRALEVGDFNKETETPSENIRVVLNKGELVSTNATNNNKHPECADLTTSMSTEWYNMVFTHVKITDNRNK